MIKFDVITIFPNIFGSYINESLIARAQEKKLIKINVHNLRDWTRDNHKTVDDKPFGGGLGMVLKIQPIYDAVESLKSEILLARRTSRRLNPKSETDSKLKKQKSKVRVVLFTPRGKKFTQKMAYQLSKLDQVIFICGRYEGVDERVAKHIADMEVSIGDYDLMGGELPAMLMVDSAARLIPGVLGEPMSLEEESFSAGIFEYPHYTRPAQFQGMKVPEVLLSGNHAAIAKWRKEKAFLNTQQRRPDLLM